MENTPQNIAYQEDEINLFDLIKVIFKNLRFICVIVGIIVVATAIVSLIMTPIYESKAVIMPTTQSKDIGMGSMLAQQFGIATPTTPITTEIVNLLKSNILKERVIKKFDLLKLLLGDDYEDYKKTKSENELLWEGIRRLDKMTNINFKQKDNTIEITVGYKDPKIARDLVNYFLAELTDYMSTEAKRVAETNKKYLESQLDKTSDPLIKTKLYALIAQQLETSMMAEVKENFAFKVLDAPRVPDKKSKPKRRNMVLISFVVSLFLGIFFAFIREYMAKQKKAIEELSEISGLKRMHFFKRKRT
ncbi:MAG TPA: Wzz/FepE/Etk N-terminal domain-containing protein [Syntrophorhabdaceae bacterium]|nr:Wzz/FepE/Etk N-terminal domain-containing protein [Syntrophorhabdaceae bacterium]